MFLDHRPVYDINFTNEAKGLAFERGARNDTTICERFPIGFKSGKWPFHSFKQLGHARAHVLITSFYKTNGPFNNKMSIGVSAQSTLQEIVPCPNIE